MAWSSVATEAHIYAGIDDAFSVYVYLPSSGGYKGKLVKIASNGAKSEHVCHLLLDGSVKAVKINSTNGVVWYGKESADQDSDAWYFEDFS